MKNFGTILIGGITVPILLLVGVYTLWPRETQPQPTFVISIEEEIIRVENTLAADEAVVQTRLDELNSTLQQTQLTFVNQTKTWQTEISNAEKQLEALQNQSRNLQTDISQLEITQTVRMNSYQTQLAQTRQQYETRLGQLQTQIEEAQAGLEEINDE